MVIAEDVQKLCKTLGNIDELQGDPEDPGDADAGAGDTENRTFTLLQGIQKLAEESKRRDRDSTHLLGTMNSLVAALNEDMRKNAEMRNTYCKPKTKCHPSSRDTVCSKEKYSSHRIGVRGHRTPTTRSGENASYSRKR